MHTVRLDMPEYTQGSHIRYVSWPPSSILPKVFVERSRASAYASQCLCGLACEELLGEEVMTKARI